MNSEIVTRSIVKGLTGNGPTYARPVRVAFFLILIVLASGAILSDHVQAESGLVLNEVELDPPGAARQWVECYNPTTSAIDLTDWTVESSTVPKTKISVIDPGRSTYEIDAGGFDVFEFVAFTLAKSSEFLILHDLERPFWLL